VRQILHDWGLRYRTIFTGISLALLPFITPHDALATNILIFGLFAVGFNLLFGYLGLLSFGHAAFFGGGAYGAGLAIAHLDMGFLGAVCFGVLLATGLSIIIGIFAIRSKGIYFAMITLALAQLVYYVFFQMTSLTGGENGLRGITVKSIDLGYYSINLLNSKEKYYFLFIFVFLALALVSRILKSPFGGAIEAIRENENRAVACGYNVKVTKYIAFCISGGFCGLAGALYALHISIVPIDILHYQTSGMVVMMALLGGMGSFFGPFIGAAIFLLIEDVVGVWTSYWQLVAGVVFILFVLYFPKGIWGSLVDWARR